MIRATTGGVMKNYRSNLMNSFINMSKGMNTILTQRTFNSFAEDPAAAAKAFRLHKSRMMVESQYDICTDTHKKYETAVACLQSIDDVLCTKEGEYGYYMKTLTGTTLSMLNDPDGDARTQLAKVLDQISQQVIQTMNQKYGDNFIFAGADGHNVPFEIKEGKLYYRGVSVDVDIPSILMDENGNPLKVSGKGQWDNTVGTYVSIDQLNFMKVEDYEKDSVLPDIHMEANDQGEMMPIEYNKDGSPYEFQIESPDELPKPPGIDEVDPDNWPYEDEDTVSDPDPFDKVTGQEEQTDQDNVDGADGKQTGGYYWLDGQYNDDGTKKLISKAEYDAAKARKDNIDSTTFVTNDVNGALQPTRMSQDADGNWYQDPNGEYYAYFKGDYEKEKVGDALITKEEYEQQKLDYEKLQYLANEKYFVDIGYGFQEDPVTGKLIESSAFNASLNGINFLGWGMDDDGDPLNIYSLVQKMKEVSEGVPEAGKWDTATWDEFNRLVGKFEKAVSNYQTEFVNLDASTGKLSSQSELLEDNFDNLVEQYSDIEDVDMVDAITSFLWAQYSYNAALRVGNSVLSQSLMDYLS